MTEKRVIPYGRQTIGEDDIAAVVQVLKSDFLTQGPAVDKFEKALADYAGARHAVVFANGTLALLAAYEAAGLGAGQSFITSPITFVATANAGLWLGAKVRWADVDLKDGNVTPETIESAANGVSPRAVITVDFAGRPVDYDGIRAWCRKKGTLFISDACHSLGGVYKGKKVGSLADMTVFSFHPVKSITTGEGGAVVTDQDDVAERLRRFRQHGVQKTSDYYEAISLGINGRLTDIQCALGFSQLQKLDGFVKARRERADRYNQLLQRLVGISLPLIDGQDVASSWHLYVIRLRDLAQKRWDIVRELRKSGVGVQVHYVALTEHPFYKGTEHTDLPNARHYGESVISLPLYPTLTHEDQVYVADRLREVLGKYSLAESAERAR